MWKMTRSMFAAAAAALALCGVAQADFYAPGSTNGWDISGATSGMTEGPAGVWTYSWGGNAGHQEFNIVATPGDWGSQVYTSNEWAFGDGSGAGSISLDTNTFNDGWSPSTNRIYSSVIPYNAWTVTGNLLSALGGSDWDNASPQGAMTWNGSYYTLTATLPDGTYDFKIVGTGSWDSVSLARSLSTQAPNDQVTTGGGNNIVKFDVDPAGGRARVTVVPAPAAATVLSVAGVLGLRRRRN